MNIRLIKQNIYRRWNCRTHCDIDRIIGLVAVYMRNHDVVTNEDFERFYKALDYTPILWRSELQSQQSL